MSMFGWSSPHQALIYTRAADAKRLGCKVMDVGLFTLAMAASEPMPVPLAFMPTTKFWALLTVSPKEPDERVAAGV
jgi:hypothetical protein